MHHQQDSSEASDALKKAKFVLVGQHGHKPPLAEAYRGPFKIKLQETNSYMLEGGNESEDQVCPLVCRPVIIT